MQQLAEKTHHELLHADGEGRRVEQDLPVLGQEADDILDEHHKILRQQLVGLRRNRQFNTKQARWKSDKANIYVL